MTNTFDFAKAQAKLSTLKAGNGFDGAAISKLCASIKTRGNNLDIDIHAAAVAALGRVADHDDTSGAQALLNAMPRGSRAKTLAEWCLHFGNVVAVFDKRNGLWTCKLLPKDERKPISLDAAFKRPFWDVEEKVQAGAFNLAALVAALIKKADKAVDEMSDTDRAALADLKVINAKFAPAEPMTPPAGTTGDAADPLAMA